MPPTIDINIGDASPPAPILPPPHPIVSKTSKPRTALPDRPNQTPKKLSDRQQDTVPDRPAKPQSAPKSPPERLLQTMDELDLYRQWSRLKKSMVARAKANPDKARMLREWQDEYKTNTKQPALRAFFNERQAKIGVTEDQIRRFKKLYELVHQCDLLHANDGTPKRELRSSTKETRPTAMRGMQGMLGKRRGPPVDWEEKSSP